MKIAEVVPLYKGKDHCLESKYRPISLLTTLSKVLEKIVYSRVYSFLTETCQLYENQYGFRANHSCEHAIGQTIGKIIKNTENKKYSVCVLLDLSKAFDTIKHTIMLRKLETYGIRGNALAWFKSYLSERYMTVKCRTASSGLETHSDTFKVEYGTPQGSCLGPLIFLIFVNDLHLHTDECDCVQFADDTTLVFSHKNLRYLKYCVESEIHKIYDWFNANKLTLNVGKSAYLLFGCNQVSTLDFTLSINGLEIPRVSHAKLLGTWIDNKLTWGVHISKLLTKLKCAIGMLRRCKYLLDKRSKKLLYYGQFHSNLCYCIGIWGTMLTKKQKLDLTRLQRTAVSLVDMTKPTDQVFKTMGILTFGNLIRLEQMKLGFKLCHELLPVKFAMQLKEDHRGCAMVKTHQYSTRNKNIPNRPKVTNNKYRSSFLYMAVKEYSDLSQDLKDINGLQAFVWQLKRKLITQQ